MHLSHEQLMSTKNCLGAYWYNDIAFVLGGQDKTADGQGKFSCDTNLCSNFCGLNCAQLHAKWRHVGASLPNQFPQKNNCILLNQSSLGGIKSGNKTFNQHFGANLNNPFMS